MWKYWESPLPGQWWEHALAEWSMEFWCICEMIKRNRKLVNDHWLTGRTPGTNRMPSGSCNVSECEFPKEVDIVSQIRTGTALGDIHVADRLSRTSCSLHPESWPLLKGISTLSDKQLPEGILFVPGVLFSWAFLNFALKTFFANWHKITFLIQKTRKN